MHLLEFIAGFIVGTVSTVTALACILGITTQNGRSVKIILVKDDDAEIL